ncbi:MAG: hypothetical protein ACKVIQ_03450 [Acidimicrobiales bacterium]
MAHSATVAEIRPSRRFAHAEIRASRLGLPSERVRYLLEVVADAHALIEAAGFPETLVHGTVHGGNVAASQT